MQRRRQNAAMRAGQHEHGKESYCCGDGKSEEEYNACTEDTHLSFAAA
jgi:hypothetical protein